MWSARYHVQSRRWGSCDAGQRKKITARLLPIARSAAGHERLSGPLKTSSALPFRADLDGSSARGPLRADVVAKVPDEWLAGNN
jgi:hypothetical protein